MSTQATIEAAFVSMLETAISGLDAVSGPRTQAQLEGTGRAATVRLSSASNSRLDFGQNDLTEQWEIVVFWSSMVDRATRITEWESFEAALRANQYLGLSIVGLVDTYLLTKDWGEAHDSGTVTMTATVVTRRVD